MKRRDAYIDNSTVIQHFLAKCPSFFDNTGDIVLLHCCTVAVYVIWCRLTKLSALFKSANWLIAGDGKTTTIFSQNFHYSRHNPACYLAGQHTPNSQEGRRKRGDRGDDHPSPIFWQISFSNPGVLIIDYISLLLKAFWILVCFNMSALVFSFVFRTKTI